MTWLESTASEHRIQSQTGRGLKQESEPGGPKTGAGAAPGAEPPGSDQEGPKEAEELTGGAAGPAGLELGSSPRDRCLLRPVARDWDQFVLPTPGETLMMSGDTCGYHSWEDMPRHLVRRGQGHNQTSYNVQNSRHA